MLLSLFCRSWRSASAQGHRLRWSTLKWLCWQDWFVFSEASSRRGCGKKNRIAHAQSRDNWLRPSEMRSSTAFHPRAYSFTHFVSCVYEAPGTSKARSIPHMKVWDDCKCVAGRKKSQKILREPMPEQTFSRWGHPRCEPTPLRKLGNELWWPGGELWNLVR